jgi:hypothetical protein
MLDNLSIILTSVLIVIVLKRAVKLYKDERTSRQKTQSNQQFP